LVLFCNDREKQAVFTDLSARNKMSGRPSFYREDILLKSDAASLCVLHRSPKSHRLITK